MYFPCFSLFSFQDQTFALLSSHQRGSPLYQPFSARQTFLSLFSLRFHSFEERNQPAPSRRQVKDSTHNHAGVKRFFRIIFILRFSRRKIFAAALPNPAKRPVFCLPIAFWRLISAPDRAFSSADRSHSAALMRLVVSGELGSTGGSASSRAASSQRPVPASVDAK